MSSSKFVCAQRGCQFELPNTVQTIVEGDGEKTVDVPALAPELCPICNNPFSAHPDPSTL